MTEANSEHKIELFAKISKVCKPLTIFAKSPVLDV